MREYSKISPKFWIGETGKSIKKKGKDAIIVATYLMTSPHSNMLGLFYQPVMFIAHETGIGMEGASEGLAGCIEAGFCLYDDASEMVWVMEMAHFQIADSLDHKDNRCKGVQNEYNSLPENPFLSMFYDKYQSDFNMTECRELKVKTEATSKPLRSQEQEQEQEQEQDQDQEQEQKTLAPTKVVAGKKNVLAKKEDPNPLNVETWKAYKTAYAMRYGVDPVRDAATNAKIKNIVLALGAEAPSVADFFLQHNGARYVAGMHQIGMLSMDYAKLRTEWATGNRMTSAKASQSDKTQTNLDAFAPLLAAAREREEAERVSNAI